MNDRSVAQFRQVLLTTASSSCFWESEDYQDYEARSILGWEREATLQAMEVQYEARQVVLQAELEVQHERKKLRHAQARSVPCPTCGAPANRNCVSASGKTLGKDDHAARKRAAEQNGIHTRKLPQGQGKSSAHVL